MVNAYRTYLMPLVFEVQERKELIKGSFRDRHFNAGSILLGFGVLEAIGGGVNTWFRTGKLFPGPHLFAGAGKTKAFASECFLLEVDLSNECDAIAFNSTQIPLLWYFSLISTVDNIAKISFWQTMKWEDLFLCSYCDLICILLLCCCR